MSSWHSTARAPRPSKLGVGRSSPGWCTCACFRRKLERERSISFQGSESKGNSNEFAPGKGGRGQVPTSLCPSTSHLSHLNLQCETVGKQSRNLALFINLLKLSCGPKEGLARAFQPTQRKSKKMNCNHSIKPEPGSTRAWEAPCLLLDSLAQKEWKSHLPSLDFIIICLVCVCLLYLHFYFLPKSVPGRTADI